MKSFAKALLIACFLIVATLSSISNNHVAAQAVTAGASGSTTSLTGVISSASFVAANVGGSGKVYPYFSTAAELHTMGSAGDYCLVSRTTGTTSYGIIWNFTSSESGTIRTWLNTLPQRNNIEVAFTATWDSAGRFAVTPDAWSLTQGSLFPYGVADGCNATSMITCLVTLENSLPSDCVNAIIPLFRSCAIAQPACLALYGKTLSLIHSYCTQQRGVIDTLFCTDGKAGGDAACAFVNDARPSGEFTTSTVTSVSADGTPTSGTNGQQGGPATEGPATEGPATEGPATEGPGLLGSAPEGPAGAGAVTMTSVVVVGAAITIIAMMI